MAGGRGRPYRLGFVEATLPNGVALRATIADSVVGRADEVHGRGRVVLTLANLGATEKHITVRLFAYEGIEWLGREGRGGAMEVSAVLSGPPIATPKTFVLSFRVTARGLHRVSIDGASLWFRGEPGG